MLQPAVGLPPPLVAERPDCICHLRIPSNDHATFAGRDWLVGIEPKHSEISDRAGGPSSIASSNRLAGVLNHGQAVFPGDVHDRIHISGMSERVDGDNGARLRRDASLQLAGIEVKREWLDIHKYRPGTLIKNGISGCNKCKRRQNNFVAFADPKRAQAKMQARGSRTDGDSVRDAHKIRDRSLKFLHLGADTQPRGSQHAHHGLDIGFGNVRSRERDSHPIARACLINSSSPGTPLTTRTSAQ